MTYHKRMRSKATGLLTGAGMIGTGKNKQFSYPYPYPRFTCTCTHVGYPNPCSCLGMTDAFHLLPLNAGRLNDYHQELLDNVYASKIEAIHVSRIFLLQCVYQGSSFLFSLLFPHSILPTCAHVSSPNTIPSRCCTRVLLHTHMDHHRDTGICITTPNALAWP